MNQEKTIKARKKHICDKCEETILKGDKYVYFKYRQPRYDDAYDEQTQIGIYYMKYRICLKCNIELSGADTEWRSEAFGRG